MANVRNEELEQFVNNNIDEFHEHKLDRLKRLNLKEVLTKKNPYLFRAKNLNSAGDLVNDILDAFLSSSEEKLFGDFLEKLAIFVAERTKGGRKSSATGIDLEFEHDGIHYLVSIKSGPNWGNSSSTKKQELDFQNAVTVLKQHDPKSNIMPVLGICYGRQRQTFVRGIQKLMGQSFWELISGDNNFYVEIIEPIGYKAKEHNDAFLKEKGRLINLFTQEFINDFCEDGVINWKKLVMFNSSNIAAANPESLSEEPREEGTPSTEDSII